MERKVREGSCKPELDTTERESQCEYFRNRRGRGVTGVVKEIFWDFFTASEAFKKKKKLRSDAKFGQNFDERLTI
jgi:hypothetical protein